MKFEKPVGATPLDKGRVLGRPHARLDGPLKVSGQATYAHEYRGEVAGAATGFVLGAGRALSEITSMDTKAAKGMPGVLLVLTHEDMPAQGESETPVPQQKDATPQLVDAQVDYYGQAVAFVVAETFEQARAAALAIEVEYKDQPGSYSLEDVLKDAEPDDGTGDQVVGDFEKAFKAAQHKIDLTYSTPDQSHVMMEPHATVATWQGRQLTVYTSHQVVHWVTAGLAKTLMVPPQDVRVVSAFVGGGFGSKLLYYADAVLAAVASRELGRPVRVALTRDLIFNHTSHRHSTVQRLRIAADDKGRFVAMGHDAWSGNLEGGEGELASKQTKLMYAGENRLVRQRLAHLDLPPGASMRAPGEAVGLIALECAVDELAEALEMDPVQLRVLNDIQYDPEKGPERPFSSRRLVECLERGAKEFGWDKRQARPGQVRDGEWLIGLGVAGAIRDNMVQPSGATVCLEPGGTLTVETQMTDIGTGSYTILGQVAAEMLGVPLDQVTVKLGDSRFPQAAGSGGSFGANSSASGLYYACMDLRRAISKALDIDPEKAVFEEGSVRDGKRRVSLKDAAGKTGLRATGTVTWGKLTKQFAQASFGAHFAEVAVNEVTGETRVRRMLSVVSVGRVLNPTTARSQCLGGMTMGVGSALMEDLYVDKQHGLFVNHNMAEYHVPVHADIPDLDVVFLDDEDDKSSPLKAKGIGELGICGVGAAVANAVYNASGVRVRDFPITLDKVLSGWEGGKAHTPKPAPAIKTAPQKKAAQQGA